MLWIECVFLCLKLREMPNGDLSLLSSTTTGRSRYPTSSPVSLEEPGQKKKKKKELLVKTSCSQIATCRSFSTSLHILFLHISGGVAYT